jgi:hypothetical protein
MKKVIRTFVVTLVLVVAGIIIAGYFYLQTNPDYRNNLLGCPAVDTTALDQQAAFNAQLANALQQLQSNDEVISQQVATLQEAILTPVPTPTPTQETDTPDITAPTSQTNTFTEEELNQQELIN